MDTIRAFHALSILLLTGGCSGASQQSSDPPADASLGPEAEAGSPACLTDNEPCSATPCCNGLSCAYEANGKACVPEADIGNCCLVSEQPPFPWPADAGCGQLGCYCQNSKGQTGSTVPCRVK